MRRVPPDDAPSGGAPAVTALPDDAATRGTATVRALLVDDDPLVLRSMARMLSSGGIEAACCTSGIEALERVEAETFDVVVSDIGMPDLGGIDFLKVLRERSIFVPVLLVTGAPDLETAVQAVEYGACKYLTKPITKEKLVDAVLKAATSPNAQSGKYPSSNQAGREYPSGKYPSEPREQRDSRDPREQSDSSEPREQRDSREPRESRVSIAPPPSSLPHTAAEQRADVESGAVLGGRYRLERLLGEGGMSEVWAATQLLSQRAVALKVLRSSLNARSEMRRRLLREARAAGSVNHPNVIDIYDVFELADGTPVMVMALLRGHTLGEELARRVSLPLEEASDVMLPVVSAVGSAHATGVIHRDLKPDNVFLTIEDGPAHVKVLDFGIAKLVGAEDPSDKRLTTTGVLVGTAGYMAPEQGLGEPDIDHRADIWALGSILYEVLAGVRAVRADNIGQAIKQIMTEKVVPLAKRISIDASVANLVDRMLAREPDARPSDLREVYDALAAHARVRPPKFGPPAPSKLSAVDGSVPPASDLGHAPTEAVASSPAPERRSS